MGNHASTLIVARPGRYRDSLRALLIASPHVEDVGQVDDVPTALRSIAEHRVDLVLLDAGLPCGEVWTALSQIKAEQPEVRCIVLADNAQQQQEGSKGGADVVLLKGFPAAELFQTVKRLLKQ